MDDIVNALKSIQEQGSFCSKRMTPIDNFHLEIKKFGFLKLPLKVRDAKALIKLAKPAKFGFRDKTLLDQNVRDAWEISNTQIKIDKTSWNSQLTAVLKLLKTDLGLAETATLKASLHNLLIYEPGQFFKYHQDTEKLDKMVATLIVVLPSSHKGGTLVVENQGVKTQFQSSRFPLDKLTFIAFYADCHHEIKALTEGYRLALTYNLTLENDTKINIPTEKKSYDTLIRSLHKHFSDKKNAKDTLRQPRSPVQCVYLFDHCYTERGLSWHHLKNADVVRAEALKAAADVLDLEIYMSLADVQETWDCESDYDSYDRRHKYSYYEDDDKEEEEQDDDNVQVNDLIDSSTVLKHWIDRDNKPLNYKEYAVSSQYIAWTKASNEFQPFESQHEGYMGNYGNTMDRWYHRAAIILWQRKDHYPILFEMDPASVFSELLKLIRKKSEEIQVSHIINSLLPYWSQCLGRLNGSKIYSSVFKIALYLKDPQLAQSMVIGFEMEALNSEKAKLLLSLQEAYGTAWCLNVLQTWSKPKDRWGTASKCKNIAAIIKTLSKSQNHQALSSFLLKYQLAKIIEDAESYKEYTRADLIAGTSERMKEMMDFTQACIIVNHQLIYAELLNHLMDHIELYPAIELLDIIQHLKENLEVHDLKKWHYQKLFNYVHGLLENEKKLGLAKIDDWSIHEKPSCQCEDCDTLVEFLSSSTKILKWPLGKDRRKHIHNIIEGLSIPVLHQTEHTGSPHKLILTKTNKLYKDAALRFDNLKKALSRLVKLAILRQAETSH